ncbi:hypothetical protein EIP75_18185 [Aquabacterium soli]|jgi:hypothetical protein|uniref:DUF2846 domain-containing protein n=1 Tax=Aquabacterium soli TaxID=2493092 RepID=A0A426V852_9BURK|nr:hypothetical protein [Aquabacterium soli]RRS02888.1 hypothetical protein EIP75_18185 [Aquabacterium soli]
MKKPTLIFAAALLTLLAGCATEPPKPFFTVSQVQQVAPPPPDQAQLVLLEPINSIQGMIPVGIFSVKDDTASLIATTGARSKAVINLPPGRHMLMANQGMGVAHFLDANVEAGKRYYVLVRFIYANGFQLRPIRLTDESDYSVKNKNFPLWLQDTNLVTSTEESSLYFSKYKENVDKGQASGWKNWLAKTPSERAELTLNPQDAIKDY